MSAVNVLTLVGMTSCASGFRRAAVFGLWVAVGIIMMLASCAKKPPSKRYELEGRVVAVDSGSKTLTVAHGDTPGLMPGMTMPFLGGGGEEWVFGKIGPGDRIHATLVMSDHAGCRTSLSPKPAGLRVMARRTWRIPEPGDAVPNFVFVNQSGKTVRLSQSRGEPLLLTFIYTRCPVT